MKSPHSLATEYNHIWQGGSYPPLPFLGQLPAFLRFPSSFIVTLKSIHVSFFALPRDLNLVPLILKTSL